MWGRANAHPANGAPALEELVSRALKADRLFIIGTSGSGKTTLANAVSRRRGLPVSHLDELATRSKLDWADLALDVEALAAQERWVAEGIHLGWTEPLLDRAELIVWLDHVSHSESTVRVILRFVRAGLVGVVDPRPPGGRFRFRQRARHIRDLVVAIGETRRYHQSGRAATQRDVTLTNPEPTRVLTARILARHEGRVVPVRRQSDFDLLLARLT